MIADYLKQTEEMYAVRANACLETAHGIAMKAVLSQSDSTAIGALATLAQANLEAARIKGEGA